MGVRGLVEGLQSHHLPAASSGAPEAKRESQSELLPTSHPGQGCFRTLCSGREGRPQSDRPRTSLRGLAGRGLALLLGIRRQGHSTGMCGDSKWMEDSNIASTLLPP